MAWIIDLQCVKSMQYFIYLLLCITRTYFLPRQQIYLHDGLDILMNKKSFHQCNTGKPKCKGSFFNTLKNLLKKVTIKIKFQ